MKTDSETFDESADSAAKLYDASSAKNTFSSNRSSDQDISPRYYSTHDTAHPLIAEFRQESQEPEKQLAEERTLNRRLIALNSFGLGQGLLADVEIAAQQMTQLIENQMHCAVVSVLIYHAPEKRFRVLARAGSLAHLIPNGFQPDLSMPIFSAAINSQRTLFNCDQQEYPQLLDFNGTIFPSLMIAPLNQGDRIQGLLLLADTSEHFFQANDVPFVETAAARLLVTWEFSQQNEDLNEFIHAITALSSVQEAGSLMEMIASTARHTLNASYTLVAMQRKQNWILRGSGQAPAIFHSFQNGAVAFLEQALHTPYTFRMVDLRNDPRTSPIEIDQPELRALIASPIRINGTSTGLLLAFGKNGHGAFLDKDVFLVERLATQAAATLESCYLYDELRRNLETTQLLSDLILQIAKAEDLSTAVWIIASTAYRLLQARRCGLVLYAPDGHEEAEIYFPIDEPDIIHPSDLIHQAMASRQTIFLAQSEQVSRMVLPIQTKRRCYGALWLELSEDFEDPSQPAERIHVLINQATIALERLVFLEETKQKANELEYRNKELLESYDQTLNVLMRALDARDKETDQHSNRVAELTRTFGIEMGLSRYDLQALKRGAMLHDIGKIGVPDGILRKNGPLDDEEWERMREHPETGAQIIEQIPFLRSVLPVIKFHQERWDGSGYPDHLKGTQIPLLARIFAVIDVFDALTSDRPYRQKLSEEEALEYLERKSGIDFDPEVVARFIKMKRAGNGSGANVSQ